MNTIESYPLVADLFKVLAINFFTAQETATCSRVCLIWNQLFGAAAVWEMSYKRDFGNHHLTYSSSNPREQYRETAGIALPLHAKNKEIKYLKTFQDIQGPFKVIGHLVIGCLQGDVVAKDLRNNNVYMCSGRPHPKAIITCLDIAQDNDGTIQVYTGSNNGVLEEWNLSSQTWTKKINHQTCAITSLHVVPPLNRQNGNCSGFQIW